MEQRHTRGGKCTVWACCRGNGLGNCLATGNGTTTCLPRCPQKVSVCMCVSLMWRRACCCWIHTITHNQSLCFLCLFFSLWWHLSDEVYLNMTNPVAFGNPYGGIHCVIDIKIDFSHRLWVGSVLFMSVTLEEALWRFFFLQLWGTRGVLSAFHVPLRKTEWSFSHGRGGVWRRSAFMCRVFRPFSLYPALLSPDTILTL